MVRQHHKKNSMLPDEPLNATEPKDLYAMVESLDIICAAILASLPEKQARVVMTLIDSALKRQEESSQAHYKSDLELLSGHVHRVTDVLERN